MVELLFIYKSNGDPLSRVVDALHKVFSPESYQCELCKITHKNVGLKKDWRLFLDQLDYPIKFLHQTDHEVSNYNLSVFDLPAIVLWNQNEILEKLCSQEISQLNSADLMKKIQGWNSRHY